MRTEAAASLTRTVARRAKNVRSIGPPIIRLRIVFNLRRTERPTMEFYADVVEDWRDVLMQQYGELISGHWTPSKSRLCRSSRECIRVSYIIAQKRFFPLATCLAALAVKDLDASIAY